MQFLEQDTDPWLHSLAYLQKKVVFQNHLIFKIFYLYIKNLPQAPPKPDSKITNPG